MNMDPLIWAEESYNDYVRHKVYDFSDEGVHSHSGDPVQYPLNEGCPIKDTVTLPDSYYTRNIQIVKERLMAAGIRLATILNRISLSS